MRSLCCVKTSWRGNVTSAVLHTGPDSPLSSDSCYHCGLVLLSPYWCRPPCAVFGICTVSLVYLSVVLKEFTTVCFVLCA